MNSHQPALALNLPRVLDYEGWVNHAGVADGTAELALWAVEGGEAWLRSDAVAGKSYLLTALHGEIPDAGHLAPTGCGGAPDAVVEGWLDRLRGARCWLVDMAAGGHDAAVQLALFHLVERARRQSVPLLIAWRCSHDAITAPELRSRLRAMRTIALFPPTDDEELLAVLASELDRMQWRLSEALLRYLIAHTSRNLGDLLVVLRSLHHYCLARNCKPSLRNIAMLLREVCP